MLKYDGYSIVMQEVPDEISLAFNITNCPHRCPGCHSKNLWEDTGASLRDDINDIIDQYDGYITCVCFMGGDHEVRELFDIIADIRFKYPDLKICLYSGADSVPRALIRLLDYLKLGPYIEWRGGLSSKNTNQIMTKVELIGYEVNHRFQKE